MTTYLGIAHIKDTARFVRVDANPAKAKKALITELGAAWRYSFPKSNGGADEHWRVFFRPKPTTWRSSLTNTVESRAW